ncbi:uncharacterized protein CTRU02_210045 [Colletotrichum truncatum]|uniref:Uncharacterized protein n=1 Tax=Colletotrichum truncatum TaxID=5467 RepID=A0ACC3YU97_COLTU|nr:uncharacterized protein CTRU02_02619 [Colletotrichum truncatum]KAF6798645.1 hypothetical protein CTRU02_02619 [Colletotrichum truncatum]
MASENLTEVYQTIEKTLHEFIQGYENAAKHNDASHVSAKLAPDCKRRILPSSFFRNLGVPTDFVLDNKSYEAKFGEDLSVQGVTKTEVSHITIDAWSKKAAATSAHTVTYIDGETYLMEIAWYLTFSEDGTQVKEIIEFIDSGDLPKFHAKCASLKEQRKEA